MTCKSLAAALLAASASTLAWLPGVHAQTSGSSATPTAVPTTGLRMPYQREFWGYAGATVGPSYFNDLSCVGTGCDDSGVGFKLYGGGSFNDILGLEVGYVNVGNADTAGGEHKGQGAFAVVRAGVPIGDRFSLFGKVGGVYSWTKVSASVPGYATGNENGLDWTYGAGATFALNRNWQLRADWDRYEMDFATGSRDVDLYSIGVQYRF